MKAKVLLVIPRARENIPKIREILKDSFPVESFDTFYANFTEVSSELLELAQVVDPIYPCEGDLWRCLFCEKPFSSEHDARVSFMHYTSF